MDNNILIADFMGNKDINGIYLNQKHNFPIEHTCNSKELLYNTSWDWLMPVIQTIKDSERDYYDLTDKIDEALMEINIEETYNTVIGFINWYNKTETT